MDNKEIQAKQVEQPAEGTTQVTVEQVKQSRRRLFRQGASVVAVTLASRPVLAWHCQSPSAWGSEQISAKNGIANSHAANKNPGHAGYEDETWTISNWINNTSRNGFGQPWAKLKTSYPGLFKDDKGKAIDYTKITVAKLFATVPGLGRPGGLGDSDKVVDKLGSGTDLQKYTIVAQLNFILLAPLGYPNDLEKCVTLKDLSDMASGSYSPLDNSSVVWGPTQIKTYLYNNYIVRP